MDQFEIKSLPAHKYVIALSAVFLMIVLSVLAPLYLDFVAFETYSASDKSPLIIVRVLLIGLCVGLLLVVPTLRITKIRVDESLVYFMKKSLFTKWKIDKLIDFTKVKTIKDRKQMHYIGKGILTYYYLIFEMNDNSKQELFLNGYDIAGVKNLFFYIRGKFPEIMFNNDLLRDSPEKLIGLGRI